MVGHLPKKISLICRLFLEREGSSIQCQVTSTRRYSGDLPLGGLEIPCQLHFCGNSTKAKDASSKAQKLVTIALESTFRDIACDKKKNKPVESVVSMNSIDWVKVGSMVLSLKEKWSSPHVKSSLIYTSTFPRNFQATVAIQKEL